MLSEVVEYVHERVPDLTRRPQHARMIPIAPYAPMASERAVHCLRQADRETLHTAREPRRLVRLYQQMQMVSLDAERQNPETGGARRAEGDSENRQQVLVPERRDIGARPQSNMGRTTRVMLQATYVRDDAATCLGFPPGAVAPSTPGSRPELELLHRTSHLDSGSNLTFG
jgi:hypothetical protein